MNFFVSIIIFSMQTDRTTDVEISNVACVKGEIDSFSTEDVSVVDEERVCAEAVTSLPTDCRTLETVSVTQQQEGVDLGCNCKGCCTNMAGPSTF